MKTKNEFVFGTISDNADPDKQARVKATYSLQGEEAETPWLPVTSIYATNEAGVFFLPEVGDQVVMVFMDTNHTTGFILGSLWHQDNTPPETEENTGSDLNGDGDNNLQFIKSRSGNMIILDDKSGEEKVQLIASGGKTRLEFLLADEIINLETDKDITIMAKGKIQVEAEEAELTCSKGLKVEGQGITFESSDALNLVAKGNLGAEGSTIKLN